MRAFALSACVCVQAIGLDIKHWRHSCQKFEKALLKEWAQSESAQGE